MEKDKVLLTLVIISLLIGLLGLFEGLMASIHYSNIVNVNTQTSSYSDLNQKVINLTNIVTQLQNKVSNIENIEVSNISAMITQIQNSLNSITTMPSVFDYLIFPGTNGEINAYSYYKKEVVYSNIDASSVFNYAINNTPIGGKIFVENGVYFISSPILIDKGLSLIGEQSSNTILKAKSPKSVIIEVNPTILNININSPSIEYFTIDQNTSVNNFSVPNGDYDPNSIVVNNSDNGNVPAVVIYASDKNSVSDIELRGLVISNAQSAIQFVGPSDKRYLYRGEINDLFLNNTGEGIRIDGGNLLNIENVFSLNTHSSFLKILNVSVGEQLDNILIGTHITVPNLQFTSYPWLKQTGIFDSMGADLNMHYVSYFDFVSAPNVIFNMTASYSAGSASISDIFIQQSSSSPVISFAIYNNFNDANTIVRVENAKIQGGGPGTVCFRVGSRGFNFHVFINDISFDASGPGFFYVPNVHFIDSYNTPLGQSPIIFISNIISDNSPLILKSDPKYYEGLIGNLFVTNAVTNATITTLPITSSPFIYQNLDGISEYIAISGGSNVVIEWSKDGSNWYNIGLTSGVIRLEAFEYVKITFTSPPNLTVIPIYI